MADETLLAAADGLELRRDGQRRLRVAWRGAADWLGPLDVVRVALDGTGQAHVTLAWA